jgi:hypothetical protein
MKENGALTSMILIEVKNRFKDFVLNGFSFGSEMMMALEEEVDDDDT